MGVLIHYKGRLQSVDLIDTLVAEMEDICDSNKWGYKVLAHVPKEPPAEMKKMINLMRLPNPNLRGISFRIHQEAEPINLTFNKYGILQTPMLFFQREKTSALKYHWNRADTHPAGIQGHIQLINLLLYLKKKYFKTLEIQDQGGYYPKENKEELAERFAVVTNTMGTIRDLMENIELKGEPADIAAQIQDAITRSLKGVEVKVVSFTTEDLLANLLKFIEHLKSDNEEAQDDAAAPNLEYAHKDDLEEDLDFEFDAADLMMDQEDPPQLKSDFDQKTNEGNNTNENNDLTEDDNNKDV